MDVRQAALEVVEQRCTTKLMPDGEVHVRFFTKFGIDDNGPYYRTRYALEGQEAILVLSEEGPVLVPLVEVLK